MDAFVLAGGAGSRMGFDKARASLGGWPVAIRVAVALRAVAERVVLVRRGAADGHPWVWPDGRSVEVVRESADGVRHPLWGVATAMRASSSASVLVAPCDVPGLPPRLLHQLAAAAPATVRDPVRSHPLVGVMPTADADRAAALAAAGRSVRDFVAPYGVLEWGERLRNVNRIGDGVDCLDNLAPAFAPLEGADLEVALEAEAARRLATRGAWIPWAAREDG